MTRLALPILLVLAAGAAQAAERAAEGPARSHLCPEDAPEGVRLPPRPGCGTGAARARREGFRAQGDGLDIRIGGRVSGDFGVRR
ncbi:hypothetical protein [Methylobacterium symbioticum]|uniref:Porin n=1 Tax=Methylobacterium symbioticum TaxID=2584084 RepID=A0A509ELW6_9HYPH|nr:hypothetical protein [Methylobacterium symbioticum]VUD74684.1 hypothetical protein MET9862_05317 [Methylobacterium symbioticum]